VTSSGLSPVSPDADPAAVLDELLAAGHGDGLPVVPPTASRLAAMLAGVSAPELVHGLVPPLFGELTVRAAAWYAVLAGSRPVELPVVVAACRAALDDSFNLLGISTTTGAPAVAVLVHGPVSAALGMTSGAGGLGTGNRANACVGRAVSLALAGIGGATAGLTDMATLGSPAKYGCCTAEAVHGPLPSLAVRRGFRDDEPVVTVVGVGSLLEVLPADGYRTAEDVFRPAAAAMAGVAAAAGDPRRAALGEQFLLLPPELAAFVTERGWDAERIAGFLFEEGTAALRTAAHDHLQVAASPGHVHVVVTGGAGVKMQLLPGWMGGTRSVTVAVQPL
jgi:hypothetical protein